MPIKSLESFLFERKLVSTSSIEILKNATIGIDVEHYLSRIYTFKKEQFLFGMGGVPSSLESYIQSDLKVFNEFNIRPIFVLPGLYLNSQQRKFETNELSQQEQHLESTWNKLYSKHSSSNGGPNYAYLNESFRLHVDPLPIRPMANDLVKYFIKNEIDYLISPYDASFQLSYLYQNNLIDSIYGSTDVLLTKIDKFILGMEFQSKDFRYVDKQKVLKELNLTERQFLDVSIMVGCSAQPKTFSNLPPLPNPNPISPYQQLSHFKIALDIFFQYNSFNGGAADLFGYLSGLNDPSLIELYFRGHAAIKYMPVLNMEGYVELYCNEMAKLGLFDEADILRPEQTSVPSVSDETPEVSLAVPTEIHNVISQRLPPEIYLYQSLGILPSKLLEAITLGSLSVRPPLESGLGEGYKRLITSPATLQAWDFQFNLITQLLARYYQVKRIDVDFWFREESLVLNQRMVPSVSARLNHIQLQLPSNFTLHDFFNKLPSRFAPSQVLSDTSVTSGSHSNGSLVATALARAFYVLQLVDNSTLEIQPAILLLQKFLEANQDVPGDILEELALIVLLWNNQCYNLFAVDRSYPGVPKSFRNFGTDKDLTKEESRVVALASRIFSLHRFNIHPINYQGPISRSLLNFRSHLKFTQELLATSMEAALVDFIARQGAFKADYQFRDQWYSLIDQLPFYSDLNSTLLGVVCEVYFENCLGQLKCGDTPKELASKAKAYLLDQVLQVGNLSFNINLNSTNSATPEQVADDFKNGIRLWNYFVLLSKIALEMNFAIKESDLELILETDGVIKQFSNF